MRLATAAPESLAGSLVPRCSSCGFLRRAEAGRQSYRHAAAITRTGWSWRLGMDFMLSCTSWAPQVTPTYESEQWGEQEGMANQQSSLKTLWVSPSGAGGVELHANREALCSQPRKPSELKLMIPSRRMTNPKQTTGWASNSNLSFSSYLSVNSKFFAQSSVQ